MADGGAVAVTISTEAQEAEAEAEAEADGEGEDEEEEQTWGEYLGEVAATTTNIAAVLPTPERVLRACAILWDSDTWSVFAALWHTLIGTPGYEAEDEVASPWQRQQTQQPPPAAAAPPRPDPEPRQEPPPPATARAAPALDGEG